MLPIIREKITDGVYINNININRFKTNRLSVTMLVPLKSDTAAYFTLLPAMLTRSCEFLPDFSSLSRYLDMQYGADLYSQTKKIGDNLALTISLSFLKDKYTMGGEQISKKLSELLCKLIFEPFLEGEAFSKTDLEIEKAHLLDSISAEYNEKRSYSIKRMIENMCRNEVFGISHYGSYKSVEKTTPKDIFNAWQYALKSARFEIMSIGDESISEMVKNLFSFQFNSIVRTPIICDTELLYDITDVREIVEESNVSQSKLVMGFRTPFGEPENTYPIRLATDILGGNTTSKFFVNIREKQSLCYYCAARFYKVKGILVVDSGVETCNVERTKNEIIKNIELMKSGDISDYEINSAKLSINNHFKTVGDSTLGLEAWFLNQIMCKQMLSPEEACERINNVTKDEIINAVNSIKLDTVFVLKGN